MGPNNVPWHVLINLVGPLYTDSSFLIWDLFSYSLQPYLSCQRILTHAMLGLLDRIKGMRLTFRGQSKKDTAKASTRAWNHELN